MDPGSIGALVPIVAIAAFAAIKVARIRAQVPMPSADQHTLGRLDALENEVDTLRRDLSETQERLDFAERLLAQPRTDRSDPPK